MTDNAPDTISPFWALIIAFILLVSGACGLLLVSAARADAADSEFCAAVAALFEDWAVVEWTQRADLPTDLELVSFVYLTDSALPDEEVQALQIEYSAARDEYWLIAYWSMRVSTDASGGQEGNHDICPVRVRQKGE